MSTRPSVLFVCVHNAGRSQMAAGFLTALSGGAVEVRSAGSAPAAEVNPAAVAAMAEVGVDITQGPAQGSSPPTPSRPPTSSSPWAAATPARSSPARATRTGPSPTPLARASRPCRPIRDEIRGRVETLLAGLLPGPTAPGPGRTRPDRQAELSRGDPDRQLPVRR
jgi:arsenate reductase